MLPDYVLLAVCGQRGLGRVGRQHLAVALALELPLLVAVTKADVAGQGALHALTAEIRCRAGCQQLSALSWSSNTRVGAPQGCLQLRILVPNVGHLTK